MKKIVLYKLLLITLFACDTSSKHEYIEVNNEDKIENFISVPLFSKPNLKAGKTQDSTENDALLSQVYEGLLHLDPNTNTVEDLLVENYSIDPSRTIYTFTLKNNIYFHDDPCFENGKGRKMTAEDVIYCFNKLNNRPTILNDTLDSMSIQLDSLLSMRSELSLANTSILLDSIKLRDSIYKTIEQPKIESPITQMILLSTYKFSIRINRPNPDFIKQLCGFNYRVYPKELDIYYYNSKNPVFIGTGPFYVYHYSDKEYILLRNKSYHEPNTPKIDALRFIKVGSEKEAQTLFANGDIDILYPSTEKWNKINLQIDLKEFNNNDLRYWNFKQIYISKEKYTEPYRVDE